MLSPKSLNKKIIYRQKWAKIKLLVADQSISLDCFMLIWWGRPDLNRRPLPKNRTKQSFTGFSRHAPELRHSPRWSQQTHCLLLEPVLMPRSALSSQSHTGLDYDPTDRLGQLSEPATIKIIRFKTLGGCVRNEACQTTLEQTVLVFAGNAVFLCPRFWLIALTA